MALPKPKQAPRPFTMVRRSIWGSERFAKLPDDATRYLYFYYLTCQHQTGAGCFILKEAYALADLDLTGADWTPKTYRARKAALEASELIHADTDTGELLIDRWWQDNGPSNDSWFAGAIKQCEAIKSPKLRELAETALGVCWRTFDESRPPAAPTRPGQSEGSVGASELRAILNRRLGGAA
jgi:hypothetical protein